MNIIAREITPDAYFVNDEIQITVLDHPMAKKRIETAPVGWTLAQIEEEFAGGRACSITADGRRVPREERGKVIPAQSVQIVCVPGKSVGKLFRQIAGLAVALLASIVAPIIAAPIIGALGLGVKAGGLLIGAITAGISIVGSLVLNALFPATQPQLSNDVETSPTYSIGGGRNRSNPFGPVPSLLGVHRVAPPYAAKPYTEIIGDDQYLTVMVCWGYGPLQIDNLRIGETSIDEFDDVEIETLNGTPSDPAPALYPNQVIEEQLSVDLEPGVDNVRTTTDNTDRVVIDIQAPSGLYRYKKSDGNRVSRSVKFTVYYRVTGQGVYNTWTSATLTGDKAEAIRKSYSLDVARGQYDVKVVRDTANDTSADTVSESIAWTAIRSVTNENPVNSPVPLALTTIRIRATSQLSGVIETLNADVSALVKSWNGAVWVDDQVSSWPADLYRHVLQGLANKKAVADSEIDLETLQEWHDFCVVHGFKFNQYRDFRASVWSTLRDICSAGRATPTFIDGKWSVIWDDKDAPIVQVFTPANSSGFKGSRGYSDKIQAFRVRFVDEENAYQQDERLVFADGYDEDNTTRYEQIEFPGVTSSDLVWRHGRYHIAQLQLRREVYEITTDFEHLACVRGDRVLLSHDVPKIGLGFGRVRAVAGDTVTLNAKMVIAVGETYVLRFRLADGTTSLRTIATDAPAETSVLDLVADAGETPPAVDDLFAFGTLDTESIVCRVRAIRPAPDMAATIELVDDAPAIHEADTGVIPVFDPNISEPVDLFQYPPTNVLGVEFLEVVDGGLFASVNLTWDAPAADGVASYLYQYRKQGGEWSPSYEAFGKTAIIQNLTGGTYEFRVKATFATAISKWSAQSLVQVEGPFRTPPNVENFRALVSNNSLTLTWDASNDIVVRDYEIRHTTETLTPSWSTATRLRTGFIGNTLTIPHIRGSFLIRAQSYHGQYSPDAAIVIADVAPMNDVNIIETVTDDGAWDGTADGTGYDESYGGVILQADSPFFDPDNVPFFSGRPFFHSSARLTTGTYMLKSEVDLGGVMTSRLSASVVASSAAIGGGFFSNGLFFSGGNFFTTNPSQWAVKSEVRFTRDDPAGAPVWSDWEEFLVGEYTARAFQFRLVLESFAAQVTPVVQSAQFIVDVPDRRETFQDVASGLGGHALVFEPPFYALKDLQITGQDMATGDYWRVTGKSKTGATITFYDKNDTIISRTFDARALGYGSN